MTERPAVLRGTPVRAGKQWPRWPHWDEAEQELLGEVLESGAWSSIHGDQVARWAAEFAALQGGRHCIAVTNGTHALEAAFIASDVGEGDEVIVPAITFVATATAALAVNATPVLVDVDRDSLCIDVAAAEAAITERTRAIVAVHLAGTACDLDALVDLCERRDLVLIEDCAHAHGTRWRGRGAGTFGSFGTFSFESSKLMTAGEGGAVITDDEALRARASSYVDSGRVEGGHSYHHVIGGSNLRMTEWQGAVLRAQLRRFGEQHRVRHERASLLDSALADMPGLRPQPGDPRMDGRARYAYVFHYDPEAFAGLSARDFAWAMAAEGIAVSAPYPSLHTLELFRSARFGPRRRSSAPRIDYASLSLPNAEYAAANTVWLEHRMLLADPEDVLDIVRAAARIGAHADAVARARRRRALRARLVGAARRATAAGAGRRRAGPEH
jgi:dTDP-4-amino-4,6-dideoxygalactose transaminase